MEEKVAIEEPQKGLVIFGRDLSQIPCFRSSFMYGIGGGVLTATLAFLGTSRSKFSTNVGFGTFFCGTLTYWFACRYNWSKNRFEMEQLKTALQNKVLYEGTDVESELNKLEDCNNEIHK